MLRSECPLDSWNIKRYLLNSNDNILIEMLKDIAAQTGATMIDNDQDIKLEDV
jgi:hypothetical protein